MSLVAYGASCVALRARQAERNMSTWNVLASQKLSKCKSPKLHQKRYVLLVSRHPYTAGCICIVAGMLQEGSVYAVHDRMLDHA